MKELLLAHLILGAIALLVVAFVAFPYRGRAVPRAGRLSEHVASVADRVDPGEGPPQGVLTTPEKSRPCRGASSGSRAGSAAVPGSWSGRPRVTYRAR